MEYTVGKVETKFSEKKQTDFKKVTLVTQYGNKITAYAWPNQYKGYSELQEGASIRGALIGDKYKNLANEDAVDENADGVVIRATKSRGNPAWGKTKEIKQMVEKREESIGKYVDRREESVEKAQAMRQWEACYLIAGQMVANNPQFQDTKDVDDVIMGIAIRHYKLFFNKTYGEQGAGDNDLSK